MVFDYDVYYRQNFAIPSLLIAFCLFLLFSILLNIYISGTIDNTIELPSFGGAKYGVEQNHGYGEAIEIDGVRYFLVTFGEFKQGDQVVVKVLPKSRFILEIELFHEKNTCYS